MIVTGKFIKKDYYYQNSDGFIIVLDYIYGRSNNDLKINEFKFGNFDFYLERTVKPDVILNKFVMILMNDNKIGIGTITLDVYSDELYVYLNQIPIE